MSTLKEALFLAKAARGEVLMSWGARGPLENRQGDPELLLDAAATLEQLVRVLEEHVAEEAAVLGAEKTELQGMVAATQGRPAP